MLTFLPLLVSNFSFKNQSFPLAEKHGDIFFALKYFLPSVFPLVLLLEARPFETKSEVFSLACVDTQHKTTKPKPLGISVVLRK